MPHLTSVFKKILIFHYNVTLTCDGFIIFNELNKLKFLFILTYNNISIYNTANINKHNSHEQKLYGALNNF